MEISVDRVLSPLLLLLLAAVSFSTLLATTAQDANITFPLPSNCSTSCGNITFQYPFGIGRGCFRPGFDLTCNTTSNPPKLFLANGIDNLEVISDISLEYRAITIKAPVAIMGVKDNSSYFSWTTPANSPYKLSTSNHKFWVIGCNATAYLVDLKSNETTQFCETTCPPTGAADPGYNVTQDTCKLGAGCCYAMMPYGLQSYSIKMSRSNQDTKYASSVKALVASYRSPTHNILASDDRSVTTVPVAYLRWTINDVLSCNEAKNEKNTYACLSLNSDCTNYTDYYQLASPSVGYYCSCLTNQGNPYVPNGCYDSSSTIGPSKDCTTKCGNITIPFPFGLEKGCYKNTWFALTCNQTSNPPTLLFNLSYSYNSRVTHIIIGEGQMEVSAFNSYNYRTSSTKPFGLLQEGEILEWVIDYKTCELAKQNTSDYACRSIHSACFNRDVTSDYETVRSGYFCKCFEGFEGNPYLPDGCKDVDECDDTGKYVCHGDCVNNVGSYTCNCPPGTIGDPTKELCISDKKQGIVLGVVVGVCVGFGTLLLAVTSIFATLKWKKISQKRIRQRHFTQNHGLLLQQLIASNKNVEEKTKIFSLEDLEKATNNFDSLRILGHGGHGTVYKGILKDQRIVAIKKSKINVKREIDEFINEVTILSQINHRNVVKLFGCCLETKVPLLVYEFISNGTLYDHLHKADHKSSLTWKTRLRIALETAGALAYLHSSASVSIFHRDMKSSNILLDEYLTTKVSDFGASRFIPLDQTRIFTVIQGTFGYLDPEYYQTCELTNKSDVYSFGVVLLELLTGEKPISPVLNGEERILVIQFLQALKENRHFELMESRVTKEATREELDQVAKLAEMCLKLKGSERPTMKEVEMQLRLLWKAELHTIGKEIVNADQEVVPLLRDISHCDLPPSLVVQSSSQMTRNYNFEMEWMDSLGLPR